MSARFDLQNVSEEYLADPYRVLAELRAHSPVHKNSDGTIVLTCYADIVQTYRDPLIWSSDKKSVFKTKF